MWNDRKSLLLSKCCVVFFMALLLLSALWTPSLVRHWLRHITFGQEALFFLTIYAGCVPAALLLVLLFVLLHRIGAGEVFTAKNTACLRHISWCCFAGAAISAASSFYYTPWLSVTVAAGFMGLIVRVIKNVFAKATELQDDAELTI